MADTENLEARLRAALDAARTAAETAVLAIERLEQMDAVVKAAQAWRHSHDDKGSGKEVLRKVLDTGAKLRDAIDEYERKRAAS